MKISADNVREKLTNLSFNEKISLWNGLVYRKNAKGKTNGYYEILTMCPYAIEKLSRFNGEKVSELMFSSRVNVEDEYVTIQDDGYIHSMDKNTTYAYVDVCLRVDFTALFIENDDIATELFYEYFPFGADIYEEEKPFLPNGNVFSLEYTSLNDKEKLIVRWKDEDGNTKTETYEGSDASLAYRELLKRW